MLRSAASPLELGWVRLLGTRRPSWVGGASTSGLAAAGDRGLAARRQGTARWRCGRLTSWRWDDDGRRSAVDVGVSDSLAVVALAVGVGRRARRWAGKVDGDSGGCWAGAVTAGRWTAGSDSWVGRCHRWDSRGRRHGEAGGGGPDRGGEPGRVVGGARAGCNRGRRGDEASLGDGDSGRGRDRRGNGRRWWRRHWRCGVLAWACANACSLLGRAEGLVRLGRRAARIFLGVTGLRAGLEVSGARIVVADPWQARHASCVLLIAARACRRQIGGRGRGHRRGNRSRSRRRSGDMGGGVCWEGQGGPSQGGHEESDGVMHGYVRGG